VNELNELIDLVTYSSDVVV